MTAQWLPWLLCLICLILWFKRQAKTKRLASEIENIRKNLEQAESELAEKQSENNRLKQNNGTLAGNLKHLDEVLLETRKKFEKHKQRAAKHKETIRQIGLAYEKQIGDKQEKDGWKVEYNGIQQGKQDMGRDLICKKGKLTNIIQCKRYARTSQIYPNTIHQLYGSAEDYKRANPQEHVQPILYTTARLSNEARQTARRLGVWYRLPEEKKEWYKNDWEDEEDEEGEEA